MEENKKRKRVANFTTDEKSLLIQLIKKRPVIESKEIDGKSILKKKMAWNSVTDEFNSNAFVHKRDTVTLKRAWDNLKAMARKTRASERSSIGKRTGDGPSDFLPISQQGALINMIEEVAPAICEINNSFDSDGMNSFSNDNKSVLSQIKESADDIHELEDSQTSCIEADVYFEENTASDEVRELCSTATSKNNGFNQARKRKPSDYIRREGVMRIKHFEVKKKIELQILKTKLENQEIKKRAAEMEEERNKILLDKAKLEYYEIKKRLGLEQ